MNTVFRHLSSYKLPYLTGRSVCSALTLVACLAAGSAQAADKGSRHHARGQYDTVTATYGVVEGDELVVISERFEVPVDTLKEQNKLSSDEIKPGQALTIAASTGSPAGATGGKPNILFIMGDDIGWMQVGVYHRGMALGETPNIDRLANEGGMFTQYSLVNYNPYISEIQFYLYKQHVIIKMMS